MDPEDGGGPDAKRKKSYSRREILEKLEECEIKNSLGKQKLFRFISGHGEVIESGPSEAK